MKKNGRSIESNPDHVSPSGAERSCERPAAWLVNSESRYNALVIHFSNRGRSESGSAASGLSPLIP